MQPALMFEPGALPELPGPAVGHKVPKTGQKPWAGRIYEPGPFPELPGPAVGHKVPKTGQKPGAGRIIILSS